MRRPLNNKIAVLTSAIPVILLLIQGCVQQEKISPQLRTRTPSPFIANEVVIAAVGDVMMPASIQAAMARNKNNYYLLFEKIRPDLTAADITFANLETPVDHTRATSGYPRFNTRPELLAALKRAGVGVVSIANNHAMDAGTGGLKRTLDNIEKSGLIFVGAGRTKAEAAGVKHMAVRGINVAFLAYTYGTNRRLPRAKPSAPGVNILRLDSEQDLARAAEDVRRARQNADLVAVSVHWGDEYAIAPSSWQKRVAAELVEAGADMVFGHHPHVLQPIEIVASKGGRQGVVAYSLGNFISSQNQGVTYKDSNNAQALRGDGIILSVIAVKRKERVAVERVEFLPLWTLRDFVNGKVIYRPVSLEREIARIKVRDKRTREDENTLNFLAYRKDVITKKLAVNPAQ